jgi:sodium-dependent dicarboxylate transporter 2/3/5
MWISNTLCTAMLCPVALTILAEMARRRSIETGVEVKPADLKFGVGLILMTGFAPAVGGMATPIGTPPNLIGLGLINQNLKVSILFFEWVGFAMPIVFILTRFSRSCI